MADRKKELKKASAAVKANNTASTAEAAPAAAPAVGSSAYFAPRSLSGGPSKISRAGMEDTPSNMPSSDAGSPTTNVFDPNYKFGTVSNAFAGVGGPSNTSSSDAGSPTTNVFDPNYKFGTVSNAFAGVGGPDASSPTLNVFDPNYKFGTVSNAFTRVGGIPSKTSKAGLLSDVKSDLQKKKSKPVAKTLT